MKTNKEHSVSDTQRSNKTPIHFHFLKERANNFFGSITDSETVFSASSLEKQKTKWSKQSSFEVHSY